MQTLTSSTEIFGRRRRRARLQRCVAALCVLTALNASHLMARSEAQVQEASGAGAFSKLTEAPGLRERRFGQGAARLYRTVGGPEIFSFQRRGDIALVEFDCPPAASMCRGITQGRQTLSAHPVAGGITVFRTASGEIVFRETSTGGVTLLPGADFVPLTVPKAGRAVVEAE